MQQYMWHMTLNSIHTVRLIPAQTLVWGIVCSRWFAYCLIIGVLSIQPNFLICVCASLCVCVCVCHMGPQLDKWHSCVFTCTRLGVWNATEHIGSASLSSAGYWSTIGGLSVWKRSEHTHTHTHTCTHTHTHTHRCTQTSAWIWKWWLGSYPLMYASVAPLCSRKKPLSDVSPVISPTLARLCRSAHSSPPRGSEAHFRLKKLYTSRYLLIIKIETNWAHSCRRCSRLFSRTHTFWGDGGLYCFSSSNCEILLFPFPVLPSSH